MDNILKALDRAKADRAVIENQVTQVTEKTSSAMPTTSTIAYTKTRVVETNSQDLCNKRVITGMDSGPVVDAYRLLRTQVLQRMREHNWNALAITSPTEHSGKSLTAVNLAISLSMEVNQTVLLVDLNLRAPGLHHYFSYRPERGISDYLKSATPLNEILFNPSIERLVVLPGREPVHNSSETLSAPQMVGLVNELKTRYSGRIILFDLPPILDTDDALAFSPYVDAALLVIEEGETSSDDLARAMEILKPVNIIGTVLNKSRD